MAATGTILIVLSNGFQLITGEHLQIQFKSDVQIPSAHAWEPVGCGPDPISNMATAAILDFLVYNTLQTPGPINPKLDMYSMG